MRRRAIASILTAGVLTASMIMTSCGASGSGSDTVQASEEATEEEGFVNMGNPWTDDASAEDVYALVNAYFIVPDGATDVIYRLLPSENLAEMQFDLDGLHFNARMKPSDTLEDISGVHGEWTSDMEDELNGSEARLRAMVDEEEMVHNIIWIDHVTGLVYSLTTQDKDLDGFDITAVAGSMYQPESEEFMPGSFVEEAAGKETFESFDELLSYLQPGNAYAYLELTDFDGKLIAVTEQSYDDLEGHNAAIEATFYGDVDGAVRFIGNAFSGGTAYPIRTDGTHIYYGSNRGFESEIMTSDGRSLMIEDTITYDYDEDGNEVYSGFLREDNKTFDSLDLPEDPEETAKLLDQMYEEYEKAEIINFTVVE